MTDNIKLPPMPQTIENRLSDFAVACAFGQHELRASAARELRQAIEEHAREAVRMNAQADIRTLIADDAYAMTFQSLGQYRSALLAALSAAPAAPQPAQAVPEGFVPQTCPHCNETWLMEAQRPPTDEKDALDLLAVLFDAYENGPSCYEDPDGMSVYIGTAIKIDDDTFKKCVDLLNRRRPRILTEGVKND